jgi:hypothetical protein
MSGESPMMPDTPNHNPALRITECCPVRLFALTFVGLYAIAWRALRTRRMEFNPIGHHRWRRLRPGIASVSFPPVSPPVVQSTMDALLKTSLAASSSEPTARHGKVQRAVADGR